MWRYVVKRLIWMIFVMIGVAFLIFTIMFFVPGDPAQMILGTDATEAELDAYRAMLGLDQPYYVQLLDFLHDIFIKHDFGVSYNTGVSVLGELLNRAPRTLMLGWGCILINTIIGVPLGVLCAKRHNGILDRLVMVVSVVGVSMPGFWVALMLIVLFSANLNILPSYGIGTWKHWVMPLIAGSLAGLANNARQTRSSVLESINADYATTARAKGLSDLVVTYKHVLPNALIPIVGSLGAAFGQALGGTVVIETVFVFPGVGQYMTTAISMRDYPIIRGGVLVLALFATLANLLVDLAYAYLDPRIKAQYVNLGAGKKGKA